MPYTEPWNPFDTSDKICFPDLQDALTVSPVLQDDTADAVVDIAVLATCHPVEIDGLRSPNHGLLSPELSIELEARCQAWFDEQRRIKAARGDSPTPSCSFKLPGIPYIDQGSLLTAHGEQEPASNTAYGVIQASAAVATATSAEESAILDPLQQQQRDQPEQHDSCRQSFTFYSPFRSDAASPVYPFSSTSAANQRPQQHRHEQLPLQEAAAMSVPSVAESTSWLQKNTTGPDASRDFVTTAVDSRLTLLMKQNLQQLQSLLQDQPVQHHCSHDVQDPQHTLQLPPQPKSEHQQQFQPAQSLQSRLTILLQQNQQQLQQLLDQHQQQAIPQQSQLQEDVEQQQMLITNATDDGGTESQTADDDILVHFDMPMHVAQDQVRRQVGDKQQQQQGAERQEEATDHPPVARQSDGSCIPGSPEKAAAAAAAAAHRAKQRVADVAASASTVAEAPVEMSTDDQLASASASELSIGLAESATDGPLSLSCAGANTAEPQQQLAVQTLEQSAGRTTSTQSPHHISPSVAVANSGTRVQRTSTSTSSTCAARSDQQSIAAAPPPPSKQYLAAVSQLPPWQGLQQMQQHRWQSRLRASPARAAVTDTQLDSRRAVKNKQTQTLSPQKHEAVQTDETGTAGEYVVGDAVHTSEIEALLKKSTITDQARAAISSSPAAGALVQAVSPVAIAAATAAAAAVAVISNVAATSSPQGLAQQRLQPSPAALAAAAAAAAASAAAAAASQGPGQQQQRVQTSLNADQDPGARSHVVRSLFTADKSAATPIRTDNRHTVTTVPPVYTTSPAFSHTPRRTRVGATRHVDLQQEQLQTGPSAWQQQRPLPWPELEPSYLSPLKAYGSGREPGSTSKQAVLSTAGGSNAVPAAAASSRRVPLAETTNSPGATDGGSSPVINAATTATAGMVHRGPRGLGSQLPHAASVSPTAAVAAHEHTTAAGSSYGVTGYAMRPPATVQIAAGVPAAEASVSFGSPALQRLWSGYKAGARSLPASPSNWYKQDSTAAGVEASGTAVCTSGMTTDTPARLSYDGAGQIAADVGTAAVAIDPHQTKAAQQQQQQSTLPEVPSLLQPVSTPAVHRSRDLDTSMATPGRAILAAALAASGPVAIDPKYYPPSARKLLEDGLLCSGRGLAYTTLASDVVDVGFGGAGVAQQHGETAEVIERLQQFDLHARAQQADIGSRRLFPAAEDPGADADVDTGTECADDSSDSRGSSSSRDSEPDSQSAIPRAADEALSSLRVDDNSRFARLVASYRQQQTLHQQTAQQQQSGQLQQLADADLSADMADHGVLGPQEAGADAEGQGGWTGAGLSEIMQRFLYMQK